MCVCVCVCARACVYAQVLYKRLGCKLAVGMPFKDLATSDSVVMHSVPPVEDKEARLALKRLQVRACVCACVCVCVRWTLAGARCRLKPVYSGRVKPWCTVHLFHPAPRPSV